MDVKKENFLEAVTNEETWSQDIATIERDCHCFLLRK